MQHGLFIGLTTTDIQYFLEKHPSPNTKIKTENPLIVAGGPSANAAIAFTYLGGNADFITCIGENSFSQILLDDYIKHNITVIDFKTGENFQPIVATVLTNITNSDRTIITHHPEPLCLKANFPNINIEEYDFVFTDGFYPELATYYCKKAKEKNIPIIFDGGSWKPQLPEIIPFVDVAICSNNYMPPNCETKQQAIDFTKKMGVKHVAISRGCDSIITENQEILIEHVNAIDSLGAGDILHGAFCWYWNNSSKKIISALVKASKIASESVKYKGTRSWMK